MSLGMGTAESITAAIRPEEVTPAGVSKESAERAIRVYTRDWSNKPQVIVAADLNEAAGVMSPEAALMIKANRPRGFFDIQGNRIVVIASELSAPDEAIEVILHEAIGHYGLRQVLGNKFQEEMLKLYDEILTEGIRDILEQYADNLPDKGIADPLASRRNRAYLAEEYAAQQAERDPAGPWYKKLLEAVRKALNLILPPEWVSRMFLQGRLDRMLESAREYVRRGEGLDRGV